MASTIFNSLLKRALHTKPRDLNRRNLFSRLKTLGYPQTNVAPILDQWVEEGKTIKNPELQRIIRDLRTRRRYNHALQVSEWMNNKGLGSFSSADHAVHLDLIGKVNDIDSAEQYFNNLGDQDKNVKTHGALLNCYVRERLVEKSLSHIEKMKELGFASASLTYNNLMCLYTNIGQFEKIPNVLAEMKANGVTPDNFSYRICVFSYAARSDSENMEILLDEMESQPHINMDWMTYSQVANFYVKNSSKEKALLYLKKCEEKVGKDALGYNYLISQYASLGNKDQVTRLWNVSESKKLNRDYITMIASLLKLEELEEAEKLLAEWEASCDFYDSRVPNVLLIWYCQKDYIEKAEKKLQSIITSGKNPTPNSWSIIAAAYLSKQDMRKAFECMKKAMALQSGHQDWRPKANIIYSILNWLGDNGDIEEIDEFVNSLNTKVQKNVEMHNALIKAYSRFGKDVDEVWEKMKTVEISVYSEDD